VKRGKKDERFTNELTSFLCLYSLKLESLSYLAVSDWLHNKLRNTNGYMHVLDFDIVMFYVSP
jgi:hypothetical protein